MRKVSPLLSANFIWILLVAGLVLLGVALLTPARASEATRPSNEQEPTLHVLSQTSCTTINGVQADNAQFIAPAYVKLADGQILRIRTAVEAGGMVWPSSVTMIWLGRTDSTPNYVFAFLFDHDGCYVLTVRFSTEMLSRALGE